MKNIFFFYLTTYKYEMESLDSVEFREIDLSKQKPG